MSGTSPLLSFYGDDFTGSSAVMEVLSFAGVPTMLFMKEPDNNILAQYPDVRAIGIAGVARAQNPDWMQENLPPIFRALKSFDAGIFHYKVCSTFDSSPTVGSIGKAIEIGTEIFEPDWIPLVVGAPEIRRYQVFGQLFAGAGEGTYRLDQHPVMSRHPVTPMNEANLAKHLSNQTTLPIGVVDMAAIKSGQTVEALDKCRANGDKIVAIDVLDDETLRAAGQLLWADRDKPAFTAGSQGVEYALVAYWREIGAIAAAYQPPDLTPVDRIFAVSGSVSPTTADQISYAENNGFSVIDFDASCVTSDKAFQAEYERVKLRSLDQISAGKDVLVTTARGPDDLAVENMINSIAQSGLNVGQANEKLGRALGDLVAEITKDADLSRAVISGGDTSGFALTAMEANALSAVAPLAAGAPLCRLHTNSNPDVDGLEVTLKGGQMGEEDFFVRAKGKTKN